MFPAKNEVQFPPHNDRIVTCTLCYLLISLFVTFPIYYAIFLTLKRRA